VRILAITVAGLVAAAPGAASADSGEDLQKRGEAEAKQGRFADAIDSFKAADRITQRASHACLISLAYTRRELWSQAQLWMSTCHARATATDPMPDWSPEAEKLIADRLRTANVAAVTIDVLPAAGDPKITVSSFAPDEEFAPRTIHLSPGTHVIFAKLGGQTKQETLVVRDKSPQRVVFDFSTTGTGETPVTTTTHGPSKLASNALLVGGGVAVGIGIVTHVMMGSARSDMVEAKQRAESNPALYDTELAEYEDAGTRFDRLRTATIALYAVGVGLAVTGYLIRPSGGEHAPAVSAVPLPEGGGFVSVGWMQ
jgi:hypothetical protein